MRTRLYYVHVFLAAAYLGVFASLATATESHAVQTMAKILMTLSHSPSTADRQTLEKIRDGRATTVPERVVAHSMLNVLHVVSVEDKLKLEAIVRDQSVPASIRTLAAVLVRFSHTVTERDKDALRPLMPSAHA